VDGDTGYAEGHNEIGVTTGESDIVLRAHVDAQNNPVAFQITPSAVINPGGTAGASRTQFSPFTLFPVGGGVTVVGVPGPIALTVSTPSDGETFQLCQFPVTGLATGVPNISITVDGQPVADPSTNNPADPFQVGFTTTLTPPAGPVTITVTAFDPLGDTVTDTLHVTCLQSLNPCANVTCPSTACTTGVCDPTSGQCSSVPVADGTACSEGDGCTAEACASGHCVHETALQCIPTTLTANQTCSATGTGQASVVDVCTNQPVGLASCSSVSLSESNLSSPTDSTCTYGSESAQCAVSLTDTTAPSLSCPPSATATLDAWCRNATSNVTATATDNCDGTDNVTCKQVTLCEGQTGTVTCTAADSSHNKATCQVPVTAVDKTPPTLVVGQSNGRYPGGRGYCNDGPVSLPITISDTCGGASGYTATATAQAPGGQPVPLTVTLAPACSSSQRTGTVTIPAGFSGPVTITVNAFDGSGNETTKTVTVTFTTCFCSYTPSEWGAPCTQSGGGGGSCGGSRYGDGDGDDDDRGGSSQSLSCELCADFSQLFGHSFEVGSNHARQITLTSCQAVSNFVPTTGAPGIIGHSATNPPHSGNSCGVLGGDLTALELNVAFDDAGLLARTAQTRFGDLIVEAGTPLDGLSVRQVLALGQNVASAASVSAALGLLPGGMTLPQFDAVIEAINGNFDGCKSDGGILQRPKGSGQCGGGDGNDGEDGEGGGGEQR
jgi:hypothetical protein